MGHYEALDPKHYYDNIVITNKESVVKVIYDEGNPSVNESRGGEQYNCKVEVVPAP